LTSGAFSGSTTIVRSFGSLRYLHVQVELRKRVLKISGVQSRPHFEDWNPTVARQLKADLASICGFKLPYKILKRFIVDIAVDSSSVPLPA
jgi:hypothetical protein